MLYRFLYVQHLCLTTGYIFLHQQRFFLHVVKVLYLSQILKFPLFLSADLLETGLNTIQSNHAQRAILH